MVFISWRLPDDPGGITCMCWMILYLNSLPLLELETYLPRPSPGEVLSFFAFHQ